MIDNLDEESKAEWATAMQHPAAEYQADTHWTEGQGNTREEFSNNPERYPGSHMEANDTRLAGNMV